MAKRVAPEMLTAINFLSTRVKSATREDWKKLDRALKYLNKVKNPVVVIRAEVDKDGCFVVCVYIDASHGIHHDCKGQGGIFITLGSGSVFARCWKLKIVTKSSTESELVALSDGLSQVIWLRDFLILQGHKVKPAIIYQDNMSTIRLAERGNGSSDRTRHINIRYYFITDRIKSNEVQVVYKKTGEMVADILTKPLQGELFYQQLRTIRGTSG